MNDQANPRTPSEDDDWTTVLELSELKPRTRYFYNVLVDGEPALEPPLPSFRTLPTLDSKTRVRVTFGGGIRFQVDPEQTLWNDIAAREPNVMLLMGDNTCSSSPVTDGKLVYAWFASAGLVAFDFEGNKVWQRDLGPVLSHWGNASSPVVHNDLLYVFHGPGTPSIFYAFDKRTGKTVWQSQECDINQCLRCGLAVLEMSPKHIDCGEATNGHQSESAAASSMTATCSFQMFQERWSV